MKNGRAMHGHRRILAMVGTRVTTRRAPTGGWDVSCVCGWDGGNWSSSDPAKLAYRKHLDYSIDQEPRRCKRCGHVKLATEMADRWSRHICKACYSDAGNEWQRGHPDEAARHKRNHHLLKTFGITLAEFEVMLESQQGSCASCADELVDPRGYGPHVDHDHDTGKVRGILCFGCNVGLGAFRDDPRRLRAAAEYLERQ